MRAVLRPTAEGDFLRAGARALVPDLAPLQRGDPAQLVMLQKTLLNIEGLGRELDPELDLWTTAKPFLENWMREQIGLKGLLRTLRNEAPRWATMLPQMPRLLHRALAGDGVERIERLLDDLIRL